MELAADDRFRSWLSTHGLRGFEEGLSSAFAIRALTDIEELSEDDMGLICGDLDMMLGERNRFKRAVRLLQSGGPGALEGGAPGGMEHVGVTESVAQLDVQPHQNVGQAVEVDVTERVAQLEVQPHQNFEQAVEADFEWFEVLQNMVFIKSAPRTSAEGIGIVYKGKKIQVETRRAFDGDSHAWVVLTQVQFEQSCQSEEADRGFALIDGAHLGLGQLLRGPVQPDFPLPPPPPPSTDLAVQAFDGHAVTLGFEAERRRRQWEQEFDAVERRLELWEQEQERLSNKAQAEAALLQQAGDVRLVVYRVVRNTMYIRESEDPGLAASTQVRCQVGKRIFSTGEEWLDEQGGRWVQRRARDCGKPCWVCVEAPGSGTGGPYAVKELGHTRVAVKCGSYRGQDLVYSMYVDAGAPVRTVKARLCGETGLKPRLTVLLAPNPRHPGTDVAPVMLDDGSALASYVSGQQASLVLSYVGVFEEDYMDGKLTKI